MERLRKVQKQKRGFWSTHKRFIILAVIFLFPVLAIASHELSVRYFQDKTCVVCHEMKDPINRWQESGTAKNHPDCASCHFDAGFDGWLEMNKSAFRLAVEHFKRDPEAPIKPKEEPLFIDESKEPGYWSHVPNSRCFKCKDAKNHQPIDQPKIHSKLIKDITNQPCKDCHNHEMRKGQKFYQKALTEGDETTG